jgi:hypothetical protein
MHCVSRPKREDFAGFLHDYSCFQTHCVSRRIPGYFRQRIATERRAAGPLDAHPLAKPALAVVVWVLRMPRRARAPMTLASALITTARALSHARTRVRLEPLAANPTRPLARHLLPPEAEAAWPSAFRPLRLRPARRVGHFSRATPGHFSRAVKVVLRHIVPHIRRRGEQPMLGCVRGKPRRWVVERTISWQNRFRSLLIRWERKASNYLALVHLAWRHHRVSAGAVLRSALRCFM